MPIDMENQQRYVNVELPFSVLNRCCRLNNGQGLAVTGHCQKQDVETVYDLPLQMMKKADSLMMTMEVAAMKPVLEQVLSSNWHCTLSYKSSPDEDGPHHCSFNLSSSTPENTFNPPTDDQFDPIKPAPVIKKRGRKPKRTTSPGAACRRSPRNSENNISSAEMEMDSMNYTQLEEPEKASQSTKFPVKDESTSIMDASLSSDSDKEVTCMLSAADEICKNLDKTVMHSDVKNDSLVLAPTSCTSGTVQSRPRRRKVYETKLQNQDDDEKRYKHNLKTDRKLNKQIYLQNSKVSKSLGLQSQEASDNDQICLICCNNKSPTTRWLLLVHLRRFHMMTPHEYYRILTSPNRDAQLASLRNLNAQPAKVHRPKMAGSLSCDYCGESFLGIRNMKRHLSLSHNTESDLEDKISYYTNEYGKIIHKNRMMAFRKENLGRTEYPCQYCGVKLSMSCTRSRHEMYTCSKNPDRRKRYHCSFCGTAYKTKEAVSKHMKKHAAHDFKYICDLCGKECKTKPMMYEHKLKVHSGKAPRFSCSVCNKGFHYKEKLEKHAKTHSDARDSMCDICGKLFKSETDVQKHRKYVHEGKYPYTCQTCGHGLAKQSYLAAHKCGRIRRPQAAGQNTPTEIPSQKSTPVSTDVITLTPAEVTIYSSPVMQNPQMYSYTKLEVAENILSQHRADQVTPSYIVPTSVQIPAAATLTSNPALEQPQYIQGCPPQANQQHLSEEGYLSQSHNLLYPSSPYSTTVGLNPYTVYHQPQDLPMSDKSVMMQELGPLHQGVSIISTPNHSQGQFLQIPVASDNSIVLAPHIASVGNTDMSKVIVPYSE